MSQALYEVCLGYGNVHGNEPSVGRSLNRLGRCSAMTPWAESANSSHERERRDNRG
jgi:hypothetical protein